MIRYIVALQRLIKRNLIGSIYLVRYEDNGILLGCYFEKEDALKIVEKNKGVWLDKTKIK